METSTADVPEEASTCTKCHVAFHHKHDLETHQLTCFLEVVWTTNSNEKTQKKPKATTDGFHTSHFPQMENTPKSCETMNKPENQQCHQGFSRQTQLKIHEMDHTKEKMKTAKSFINPAILNIQRSAESASPIVDLSDYLTLLEKMLPCPKCDMKFSNRRSLKVHELNHNKQQYFQCNTCDLTFRFRGKLTRHELTHTKERSKAGIMCQTAVTKSEDLHKHQPTPMEVGVTEKNHQAERDDSSVSVKEPHEDIREAEFNAMIEEAEQRLEKETEPFSNSKADIQTKAGRNWGKKKMPAGSFSCKECGQKFSKLFNLKRHEIVHTGKRLFPCPECNKNFSTSDNLKRHLMTHMKEKPFSCRTCERTFKEESKLLKHEMNHAGQKPFACLTVECSKTFAKSADLKRHQMVHSGERAYHCNECDKAFSRLHHLQRHEIMHTGKKQYACAECGKTFAEKFRMKVHELSHTGEYPYPCHTCDKKFRERRNLERHAMSHTSGKPFTCSSRKCREPFATMEALKAHERTHPGGRPFQCPQCDKSFKRSTHVYRHQFTAHKMVWKVLPIREVQTHQCSLCEKSFKSQRKLNMHKIKCKAGKLFNCPECNESFNRSYNLKRHEMTIHKLLHSKKISNKCKSYDMKNDLQTETSEQSPIKKEALQNAFTELTSEFKESATTTFSNNKATKMNANQDQNVFMKEEMPEQLKTHKSIHSGERPYHCKECDKSFSRFQHLQRHEKMHTGKKEHACDECGKTFAEKARLKVHELSHTGEYPYQCQTCDKKYRERRNLERHAKSHTTGKPFTCSSRKCREPFATMEALKTHEKTHPGGRPFQCPQCDKSFKKSSHVYRHQLTMHKLVWKVIREVPNYQCSANAGVGLAELLPKSETLTFSNNKATKMNANQDQNALIREEIPKHQQTHAVGNDEIQIKEKQHVCPTCDKTFRRLESLKQHLMIHTGEKPFSCKTCEKTFRKKINLKHHEMNLHTGMKPFACSITPCSKTFVSKKDLNRHQVTHIEEKPLIQCTSCEKTFHGLDSLKHHLMIHTGEKPFPCNFCEKTFRKKITLKHHEMNLHTGIKPFACSIDKCNKTFVTQCNLKRHQETHTEEKPFQCTECDKNFSLSEYLKKHMVTHSGQK